VSPFFRSLRPLILAAAIAVAGCKRPYRVGDHVLVEWEEGKFYPAYVVEVSGRARYRVHFDGYDSRWDEDVSVDRIAGLVEGPVNRPPPPTKVLRTLGLPAASSEPGAGASPYRVGDRIRVTWRGSTYPATVIEVEGKDRVRVHYEGHESAWDESVHIDRIANKRP